MEQVRSIRTFIGAKDYNQSREFYLEWGFKEYKTSEKMSFFYMGKVGFYLQDYYVKDWVDNTMAFLEVENLEEYWKEVKSKELDRKFKGVRYVEPKELEWGSEGFIYDPSGVLWHVGNFKN